MQLYSPDVVKLGAAILSQDAATVAVGNIKDELWAFLEQQGISYKSTMKPEAVLVHPKNRGGLLINPHNAHRNGSHICRVGANVQELHGAVCFEMQNNCMRRKAIYILIFQVLNYFAVCAQFMCDHFLFVLSDTSGCTCTCSVTPTS